MNGLTQSESTDWMITSEALNRHIPPLGIVFSDIEENQVQTRYGFTIGPVGCLIAENTLSEVVNNPVIYKLPTLSKILKGVINQRGNIIPVFDLREMLGVNSADSTTRTVLILGQGGKSAGLLIDG